MSYSWITTFLFNHTRKPLFNRLLSVELSNSKAKIFKTQKYYFVRLLEKKIAVDWMKVVSLFNLRSSAFLVFIVEVDMFNKRLYWKFSCKIVMGNFLPWSSILFYPFFDTCILLSLMYAIFTLWHPLFFYEIYSSEIYDM